MPHERTCGECSLCCRLEKVPQLNKPRYQDCQFFFPSCKCSIYGKPERPRVCHEFKCAWLTTKEMSDDLKPSKTGAYIIGNCADSTTVIVVCDPDGPANYDPLGPKKVTEFATSRGYHAIIMTGHVVMFAQGVGREMPETIKLDWTL